MARKGENIYKRKDGRWEGRYIKEHDDTNKAIYGYVYAKSYAEVKIKLNNAKTTSITTSSKKESILVFSDWMDIWIEQKRMSVKHSTYMRYKNSLELHIKPKLGDYRIHMISTEVLQSFFYNESISGRVDQTGGLSTKTLSEMLMIIKSIFSFAESRGETLNCRADQIIIKKTYKEMRILSFEEERRLNIVLFHNQDIYKFGILVYLYTGIRIGELCALKWENILFEEKILRINKTMQRIQCENDIGKTNIIISDPKSSCSIRQIPLPDFLISEIKKYKGKSSDFFLSVSNKEYTEPRTMQYRFQRYIAEANIEKANFHCLRHTFATRCVEKGFEIKTLSEILGHSSVKITLDRYVHVTMQMKRNNMSKVELAV